jgi:hypothetical protein
MTEHKGDDRMELSEAELEGAIREGATSAVNALLERMALVGWIDDEGALIPLAHRPVGEPPEEWRPVYTVELAT